MEYKVGDKVRVRGDLEVGKNYGSTTFVEGMKKYKRKITEIEKEFYFGYGLKDFMHVWTSEMLRPAEFKIWCETEEEKQAVLEELEKEGYRWKDSNKKPTEYINDIISYTCPMVFYLREDRISYSVYKGGFDNQSMVELTPSEFTGIDSSEKIIIAKTPTGATASYGDKTVTTEGDFENASRQALVEVLCPFKVGDKVKNKYKGIGEVTNIKISSDYHCVISVYHVDSNHNVKYYINELEPYTEPLYNAKLFCIRGSGKANGFELGYIYEVKDGKFTDSNVDMGKFKNLEEINSKLIAQFMEIKGGLDE